LAELVTRRTGLRRCDGAKVKEGRLIQERKKSMKKIIAAAAFAAAPWQPAHAQTIVARSSQSCVIHLHLAAALIMSNPYQGIPT